MKPGSTTDSRAAPSTLVIRMAGGDDGALASLYDAYGHVVYALALAITGAEPVAESVVSQAFGEAWRSASAFDVRSSVLAWLTAIVRRMALRAASAAPASPERRSDAADSRHGPATTANPVITRA